ncbi:hypothetical protein [Nocardia sp. NPDC058666]|uniref:hypothetical protein n=1 Tax=Nocardia sp. NPDC058666 TaxID=3346587 RepID=UPI0036698EE6
MAHDNRRRNTERDGRIGEVHLAGVDGGTVSCKVTVDGKVIAEDQASGVAGTATCQDTAVG